MKTIVIIGASDGIGRETAKLFSARGDRVFNVSRRKCDFAENFFADIADENEREAAFRALSGKITQIDILLYFAGVSLAAPVEKIAFGDYARLFEVNLFGFIETVKFALPYLKKGGGKIIAASSLAARVPILFDSFYSASKLALDAMCEGISMETKQWGVQAASLHIGGCNTDFTFKRKIYSAEDCSCDYALRVLTAAKNLAAIEQKGLNVKKAGRIIVKFSLRKTLPLYKSVSLKCGAVIFASKLLPRKTLLSLSSRYQLKDRAKCALAKRGRREFNEKI